MEHRQWLNQYRDELKGIAILWIVFFHAQEVNGFLRYVQRLGYGGVDIFFFLMGYGLAHSLRNSDDLREYWRRRMWRILPSYIPLILVWSLVMLPGYQLSTVQTIRSAVGNWLGLGYWFNVPKSFNWYVSALFMFLLLAPFFYGFLARSSKPRLTVFIELSIVAGLGLCCVGLDQYMAISRLPVFILGIAFSMDWRPVLSTAFKRIFYTLSLGLGLFLVVLCYEAYPELLLTYGMYWHPFVLITPPLCVLLCYFLHKTNKARRLFAPLRVFGQASFEIFLVNIWLVELGKKHTLSGYAQWAVLCMICLGLGVAYHLLVNKVVKALRVPKQA